MNIAIIPARGGSKRIPRKNIKLFCNKPIIAYSIETAIKSNLFDRIIVSTDDHEIAEVSKSYGAEIPFIRSDSLSNDYATTHEVIGDSISRIKMNKNDIDNICCIYATAPLIKIEDLCSGLDKIEKEKWDVVFAAAKFSYPIFRSFKIKSTGGLDMIFPDHYFSRSQDLDHVYHDAGQFYWAKSNYWLTKQVKFNDKMSIIEIPSWRTQDIDTEDDWLRAEILYSNLKSNM